MNDLPDRAASNENVVEAFAKSAVHAALQSPYDGIKQLVNHVTGSRALPDLHLVEAPKPAEFGSANWYAEQFGGAVGMIAPFLAARKVVGMTPLSAEVGAAESLNLGALGRVGLGLRESFASGALLDFAGRPVDENKDFWAERMKNGLVGGITFTALSGAGQTLKWAPGLASESILANAGRNAASGAFAGFVNTESNSLISGNGLASSEDLLKGMYGFSVVGVGLGLWDHNANTRKGDARARQTSLILGDSISFAPEGFFGRSLSPKMSAIESTNSALADRVGASGQGSTIDGAKFYLRGRINAEGVWEPVRNISEFPFEAKSQVMREVSPQTGPLFNRVAVDRFLAVTAPVLKGFEPLPVDAPNELIAARAKTLEDAVNQIAREHGLPEIRIKPCDSRFETALVSGAMLFDRSEGYIGVRQEDLYQNPELNSAPLEKLAARINHEFNHSEQVNLIFRHAFHDRTMLGSMKGKSINDFSNSDLNDLKESVEMRINTPLSREYFDRLVDNMKQHPQSEVMTDAEIDRARNLTTAFIRGSEPGPEYRLAAQRVTAMNKMLQDLPADADVPSILDGLSNLDQQNLRLGRQLSISTALSSKPSALADFLTQSHEGENPSTLLDGVKNSLESEIEKQNDIRRQRYKRYMLAVELEAWFVEHRTELRARQHHLFDTTGGVAPAIH